MKTAGDLFPWKVTDISLRPYKAMWSMNPSIHFDGALWRCLLRCTDYAMPDGVMIRSERARPGEARTKNAMVIFDPASWKPVEIYKMHEHDNVPRAACENVGYEDVRIFATDKGGLQGIAASLHLRRDGSSGSSRNRIPEQVLLSFNENYDVVSARPIRGTWSGTPQKNWVPFDCCAEPRFLYSIGHGTMFGEQGAVVGDDAIVRASTRPCRLPAGDVRGRERARERAQEAEHSRAREQRRQERRGQKDRESPRFDPPPRSFESLRGGTQLVRVGDDAWLGIGHEMTFIKNRKYYWHVWYLVDSRGVMTSASPPMKLAPNGIEFAAGLAIDGDRIVVSFGIDDMESKIGETTLSAVLPVLRPISR